MTWDHRYRRLDEGEIVIATDEVQNDDGSWRAATERCVGKPAPNPLYTSHRVYRRAIPAADARAEALKEAAAVCDTCPDSHWGPFMKARILALITEKQPQAADQREGGRDG